MCSSMKIIELLDNNMNYIDEFHVSKIALFGSFARDEQTELSDVDILVEFEDGHETFDSYMDLKFFLEDLLSKKVDLVIFNTIKPSLKPSIMRGIKYAKGA